MEKSLTDQPNTDPGALLQDGAQILGLTLPAATLEQFRLYLEELKRWNRRINLTALRTDRDIIIKHFLDSLAILPFLGRPASLADLGSGAGFPGLVLKLARPETALTLVEARGKKAAFLTYLVSLFNLTEVEVAQAHLTPGLARNWGPRFAGVVSRAAFALSRFLELAAPLLLPGGRLMALKGPALPAGELEKANQSCPRHGLSSLRVQEYRLPLTGEPRLLVLAHRLANQDFPKNGR
ncbi:MAG: 16S rRNA (guanine(527)-N(7))-methyltransferase RsmG [Thermodesulfobacteriota bacterium]